MAASLQQEPSLVGLRGAGAMKELAIHARGNPPSGWRRRCDRLGCGRGWHCHAHVHRNAQRIVVDGPLSAERHIRISSTALCPTTADADPSKNPGGHKVVDPLQRLRTNTGRDLGVLRMVRSARCRSRASSLSARRRAAGCTIQSAMPSAALSTLVESGMGCVASWLPPPGRLRTSRPCVRANGRTSSCNPMCSMRHSPARSSSPMPAHCPPLRAVFSLHAEPLTVMVRGDSGIQTIADAKGRRVNVGREGSGMRVTATDVLTAFGWKPSDFPRLGALPPEEQEKVLCQNEIDVATFVVGHPSGWIQDIKSACDARVVPVTGPAIDALLQSARSMLSPQCRPRCTTTTRRTCPPWGCGRFS